MKWAQEFVAILIILCGAACVVQAQMPDTSSTQSGAFAYDVIPFRLTDTTGRVDVYLRIPYSSLQFIHELDKYSAKYSLIIQFRSRMDSIVEEKTFPEMIVEKSYENTTKRAGKFSFIQKVFPLPVGDYTASLTLSDNNSHFTKSYTQKVHIPDYAHLPVAMSGILMAGKITSNEGKKSITPYMLSSSVGERYGLQMFFEIYDRATGDTIDAVYTIIKPDGVTALTSRRTPVVITSPKLQQFLAIPIDRLSQAKYTVTLGLFTHVSDTSKPVNFDSALVTASHPLAIDWGIGIPRMLEDITTAIQELRWVATSSEMDSLEKAPTSQEIRARFDRFWERRNPTPGSVRNAAMEQYYSRVQYANEHFKSFNDGWQSDQGMVYIVYGQPTTIDSHPFDRISYGGFEGPYVIWTYERYGLQYMFIDEDGFGDYHLAGLPPIQRYEYGR